MGSKGHTSFLFSEAASMAKALSSSSKSQRVYLDELVGDSKLDFLVKNYSNLLVYVSSFCGASPK